MITETPATQEWIVIALITRPHGVRGEVMADVLTDFPQRFEGLRQATILHRNQQLGVLDVESSRFHKNRVLLKFAGYDTPEMADTLRGASLVVSSRELTSLDQDQYYLFDLEGCAVQTLAGELVGTVIKVNQFGAAPLLVVTNGSREMMIPFTREICPEVAIDQKKIVIDPPLGLLDL